MDTQRPLLTLLIATVCIAGTVVVATAGVLWENTNMELVVALAVLTVAFEMTDFSPFPNSRVSVSAALIIAAAASAGLAGVAIVCTAAVASNFVAHPKPVFKVAFNEGTLLLAGASSFGVFEAFGAGFSPRIWPDVLVPAIIAGGVFFAVNSALVASAISIDRHLNPVATWAEGFGWLAPHYVLLGVVGVLFASAYAGWGIAGIAAPLVPLAMAWLILNQHSGQASHAQSGAST